MALRYFLVVIQIPEFTSKRTTEMAMLQKNTTGIKTTVTNKKKFKDKNGAF